MEPKITCARGYVDIKADHREELNDSNLFSPAELLYPLGNTRDDSIRTAIKLLLQYKTSLIAGNSLVDNQQRSS